MTRPDQIIITGWSDKEIRFSDGSKITHSHSRDCCETNYPDFSVLEVFYHGEEFRDYYIEPVKDAGFNLCMTQGAIGSYRAPEKIFIPCYSIQNGFYSTNLNIEIVDKKVVTIPLSCELC